MIQVAPHLKSAGTLIANIWLLQDSAGRKFLIDSGHPIERLPLLARLFEAGVRGPGDLTAILLTHRHSDHAGNAAWLRKRFGARVACHKNDADILSGRKCASPLCGGSSGKQKFYERWLCKYEDVAPAACEVDEVLDEGPWNWGFNIVSTPGHTEGSVMLYHEPTATLFSGDSILVGHPLRRSSRELRLCDPSFSEDAESCHLAVKRYLRALPRTDILCSGHGPVLDQGTQQKLLRLAR